MLFVHGSSVTNTDTETHHNASHGSKPNGLPRPAPYLCPTPDRTTVGRNWQFCLPLLKLQPLEMREGLVGGLAVKA